MDFYLLFTLSRGGLFSCSLPYSYLVANLVQFGISNEGPLPGLQNSASKVARLKFYATTTGIPTN